MAGGQPGTREACAGGPWQWGLCSGLAQKLHLPHSTTWLKALMGRVLSPSPFQIRLRKFWVCLCCINPGGYQSWATSDHLYFSTCTAIDPSSYKQYIDPVPTSNTRGLLLLTPTLDHQFLLLIACVVVDEKGLFSKQLALSHSTSAMHSSSETIAMQ